MDATQVVLLREIRAAYAQINGERFGRALTAPVFDLHGGDAVLGRWTASTRTLSLAWTLLTDHAWGEVVAVLEHEMAHQYVHEVLGVHDETAHGPTFRRVCGERGIDARAKGAPVDGGQVEPKAVRRVRKLLALAESPEPHEARAAMAMAFKIMLQHNIASVDLDEPAPFVVRQVGPVRARRPKHESLLAGLLAAHFFVDVTLVPAFDVATGRRGRAVEVVGAPHNVALAAYAWDFVIHTADALARPRALSRAQRARFLEGVVLGFRERLEGQAQTCAAEEGLVWLGDPALETFVARRHPRRRRGRRLRVQQDADHAAGVAAGRRLVFRRPIARRDEPTKPRRIPRSSEG